MPNGRLDPRSAVSSQEYDALAGQLLQATRDAVAATHEILGVIDVDLPKRAAFLARDQRTGRLAMLVLERDEQTPDSAPDYAMTEATVLDASVPAPPQSCPECHASLLGWEPRCANCGTDVSGPGEDERSGRSEAEITELVRREAGPQYEVLGAMRRATGGGLVHFARARNTGALVLMHLRETRAGSGEHLLVLAPVRGAPLAADDFQTMLPPAQRDTGDPRRSGSRESRARGSSDAWALVGRVLAGRYEILHRLGEGGMGEVYLAEHLKMKRRDAIKVMRPSLLDDQEAVDRFTTEAYNASRISHQNVATVYDFGETAEGVVFIAMEYVPGRTLSDVLADEGALAPERAVAIARQVAEGLGAAHDLGIVHRDLKPDNIMVVRRRDGVERVKVVDFGIAKAMQSAHGRRTRTGFVLGTPAYMSPEQLTGDPIDGRSDLYSLGCILYEMLTGEATFGKESGERLINRRLTSRPPHPRQVNPRVPRALDEIVARALARRPVERYQTAAELSSELATALTRSGGWRRFVPGGWRGDRPERTPSSGIPTSGAVASPAAHPSGSRPTVRLSPKSPAVAQPRTSPSSGATAPRQPIVGGVSPADEPALPLTMAMDRDAVPVIPPAPIAPPPAWIGDERIEPLPEDAPLAHPTHRVAAAAILLLVLLAGAGYLVARNRRAEPPRLASAGSQVGQIQPVPIAPEPAATPAGQQAAGDIATPPPAASARSSGAVGDRAARGGGGAASAPPASDTIAPATGRRASARAGTHAAAARDSALPVGGGAGTTASSPAPATPSETSAGESTARSTDSAAPSPTSGAQPTAASSLDTASPSAASDSTALPPSPFSAFNPDSTYAEWEVQTPAQERDGNVRPGYRVSLRRPGIRDTISVQYVVDTSGVIDTSSVKLLRSTTGPNIAEFRDSLLAILPSWRYTPAQVKGHKVRERLTMLFIY